MCVKESYKRRGKRGGKKVKAREEKKLQWSIFEAKLDTLNQNCDDLRADILIHKIEYVLSDEFENEMVLVNTPKSAKETKQSKPRTPLPVLKCDVGDCPYTCKYGKHMKDHKAEAHSLTPEDSVIDASVSISELDVTKEPVTESQEEAKVHNSMDGHPHSTLKTDQSCPLGEEENGKKEGTERKKKKAKHSLFSEGIQQQRR